MCNLIYIGLYTIHYIYMFLKGLYVCHTWPHFPESISYKHFTLKLEDKALQDTCFKQHAVL